MRASSWFVGSHILCTFSHGKEMEMMKGVGKDGIGDGTDG